MLQVFRRGLLAQDQASERRNRMSRIRSIHPGIWTDEAFMSLSAHARLLLMGLWTEAWDDGVFEWKPLTLKARIFPVDAVDVLALLEELSASGVIAQITSSPKPAGAIKNFQKYQRPKKPNSSGMMRDEWLEYVGARATPAPTDDNGSEPVPNQFPTPSEKSPQMEDEGGRMKEKAASQLGASAKVYDRLIEAASSRGQCHQNLAMGIQPIIDLIAKGYDLDVDILPVIRERATPTVRSWTYFVTIVVQRHAERQAIPTKPKPAAVDWPKRVDAFYVDGIWPMAWGPRPGDPGCEAPAELLKRTAA
jgi:hypothetical protein